MPRRFSPLSIVAALCLAAWLTGCGEATPPPPVTPAGMVLPPEVELSPDEAAAHYRPQQP